MWVLKAYSRNRKCREADARDAATLNAVVADMLASQPGVSVDVWARPGGFVGSFRGAKDADGAYTGDPGIGVGTAGGRFAVLPLADAPSPTPAPEPPTPDAPILSVAPEDPDDWL